MGRCPYDHPATPSPFPFSAGVVAVEEMGGPSVPWAPGRTDALDGSACPPDGRLPDASQGAAHVRDIFYRMGFDDREIVALSGAHTLGRCHADRSGFVGPWTNAPTTFSNLYFVELTEDKWRPKKWAGPAQYEDAATGTLMMLPTDMALLWDRKFKKVRMWGWAGGRGVGVGGVRVAVCAIERPCPPFTSPFLNPRPSPSQHVYEYAKDEDKFRADFAAAFGKLLDLGVPRGAPAAA